MRGCVRARSMAGVAWHDVLQIAGVAAFAVGGTALSVADLRSHRLPDRLVFATGGLVAGFFVAAALTSGDLASFRRAVVAAFLLCAAYFALALARPDELGFGDVKLAAVVGFVSGWFGWSALALATVGTFVLSGGVAGALLLTRRATRRTQRPLGPFMIAATLVAVGMAQPLGW